MAHRTRLSRSAKNENAVTTFPPFRCVSIAIGLSILGILVRLQVQDHTLPSDLLIADISDSTEEVVAPRMVRAVQRLRQHPQFDPSWDILQRLEAEQTGRVLAPRQDPPPPEVNFVEPNQLAQEDAYAASWLQITQDFLAMDIETIDREEDAAYLAIQGESWSKVRMTMDWLDFSLEHLSSWCNMMEVLKREIPFIKILQRMEGYVSRGKTYPVQENPVFRDTLAVIAFTPYPANDNKHQIAKAHDLTVRLLAATIESLRRAGFGRTVVVGMTEKDGSLAQEAFQYIQTNIRDSYNEAEGVEGVPTKLGYMEVAYVKGSIEHAKTASLEQNVPKAALQGLQDAFQNDKKDWLGDHKPEDWKYIYLTQADSLLQTKPASLPVLKQQLDEGRVLIPHRLQPIPHQRDVPGTGEKHLFLPAGDRDFGHITELNALAFYSGICCDEHDGPDAKPGLVGPESCGDKPWYKCDFDPSLPKREHNRIRHYSLIKLTQGSQLTLLAGQESGRRCIPPTKKLWNFKVCGVPKTQRNKLVHWF